jgi:hypothetical protein
VPFVHRALQAGALPSIGRVDASLSDERQRASLTGGFVRAMHELRLTVDYSGYFVVEPQLAAVGLIRQLPALTRLEVDVIVQVDDPPVVWPPFIPPILLLTCPAL